MKRGMIYNAIIFREFEPNCNPFYK